jgi:N-methylhydantoinase A/oxoprolinase/acetone carboxylase beta subunit
VKSIGLGGGSLVRRVGSNIQVGPESVGYKLPEEALVFGGTVPTATDYMVASSTNIVIGEPQNVRGKIPEKDLQDFRDEIKNMLEHIIDTMKTSQEDLPVLLVGGGAILAPDTLKGASRVIKPEWSGVANAIGAAMARVSAVIDTIKSTEKQTKKEILAEISKQVKQKTIDAGALPNSVQIVEVEDLPLQYVSRTWTLQKETKASKPDQKGRTIFPQRQQVMVGLRKTKRYQKLILLRTGRKS